MAAAQGGGVVAPAGGATQGGGTAAPAVQPARIGDISQVYSHQGTSHPSIDKWSSLAEVGDPGDAQALNEKMTEVKQGTGLAKAPKALGMDEFGNLITEGESGETTPAEVMTSEDADAEMRARYDEWKAFMEGDDLGEPLHGKFVTATIDGEKVRVPVSEAIQGYQRNRDYTNNMRQFHQLQREVQVERTGYHQVLQSLQSGGQPFLRLVEYLGPAAFKSFHEAALEYGNQLAAEEQMTPQQKAVYQHARQQEHRARMLEMQNAQLQAQLQQSAQPEPAKERTAIENALAQMIPRAVDSLKRQGVEWFDDAHSRSVFEQHFAIRTQGMDPSQLSTSLLEGIFRSAAEEIQHQVLSARASAPAPLVPPVGVGSPQPQTVRPGMQPNGRAPKSERIGDIGRLVHQR